MAIIGYINDTHEYRGKEYSLEFMNNAGCSVLYHETDDANRPFWRYILSTIEADDTLIIGKACNAMQSTFELVMFLKLCNNKGFRLISVMDGIDSFRDIYNYSSDDLLRMTFSFCTEDMSNRASRNKGRGVQPIDSNLAALFAKKKKLKDVINMYHSDIPIDDIMKLTGIRIRATIFRILHKYGISNERTTRPGKDDEH